ncbi:MAG: hypothetical protein NTW96_09165 [Planctomycetia bacterium]|nr:hypothetical protein [Planctomycetia bacterium]
MDHEVNKQIWLDDEGSRIIVDADKKTHSLLKTLRVTTDPFDKDCTIIWGIKPYQVGYGTPPQTRQMVDNRVYHATRQKGKKWKPLLVGTDVDRYRVNFPGKQYIKYGKWLMYPSNEGLMQRPKILLRQTSAVLRACYEDAGYYCQNSVFLIHSSQINLKLLLGLLNSRLIGFVYRLRNPQAGKVFAEIKPSVIKELPICRIDPRDKKDKTAHDRMVTLVDSMLSLHKHLAAARSEAQKSVIQRQIGATDAEIDRLVYDLYGLTAEEIAIVEASDEPAAPARTGKPKAT